VLGWLRRRRGSDAGAASATAQLRHAIHYVLTGDLASAEQALSSAARGDSSSIDVYMALANLYRTRGEIGRAIHIHQNVLLRQELPDALRREALLGLALDFRAGGFLRRAAASFEELLAAEPQNLQALRELERIRVEAGEWEEAIRIRRRIGSSDSRSPSILAHLWVGLGRARAQAGREADARKAFRRALGRDRRCAEAFVELGDQSRRLDRPRKAIGLWRRALPLHAAIGPLLYPRFSEAFAAVRDLDGFEALLRERLAEEPADAEASLWLARAIAEQKRGDEALAILRRLLDQTPADLAAHAEIGRILVRERRDFEALKSFEELLDRLPLARPRLRCRSCGTHDATLHWRCPQCGEWDSFV
jgi:lipopolysaccharide biosynthesis regulator YciM